MTHLAGEYQQQQARWTVTTSACGTFGESFSTSSHQHYMRNLEHVEPTSPKGLRRKEDTPNSHLAKGEGDTMGAPIHGQDHAAQDGEVSPPLLSVNSMETHSLKVQAAVQRTMLLSPRVSPCGLPLSPSPSPLTFHRRRIDAIDSNTDESSISPRQLPPPPPPSRQASTALPADAKSGLDGNDSRDSNETSRSSSHVPCRRDNAGGQANESALSPPRPPPPPPTRQTSAVSVTDVNDGGTTETRDGKDYDRRYSAGREVPREIKEDLEQTSAVVGGDAASDERSAMNDSELKVDTQGFLDLGALQKEPSPPRGAAVSVW